MLSQPAMGQGDLQQLKERLREVNQEIKEISDRKNVSSDPMEDKLALFRQQAAIIGDQHIIGLKDRITQI